MTKNKLLELHAAGLLTPKQKLRANRLIQAQKMDQDGVSRRVICEVLDITPQTFLNWIGTKHDSPGIKKLKEALLGTGK